MSVPEELLKQQLIKHIPDVSFSIEIPPDQKLGDLAIPCFPFAKQLKKSPHAIAQELAEKLEPSELFSRFEAQGPYLNVFFDQEKLLQLVVETPLTCDPKEKKLLFEYPSPNTNKPLHLGHLRNMLLGSSIATICKAAGFSVIQTSIINDRGVHICKSMLAYQKNGEGKTPESMHMKSDHFVGHWYVEYTKLKEAHPEVEQEIQDMLEKWESGDKEIRSLWKKMNSWTLSGHEQTYNRLNIHHDVQHYESDIYTQGKEIAEKGLADGLFFQNEKGIVVDLGKLGEKVLLRSNGTSVYMTQDLYLAKLRADTFHPDAQIYIVGDEQRMHFEQLFAVQKLLHFPGADSLYHLAYGMISLPHGRMKSREGTVVDTDVLLEDMQALAATEVKKRHPDLATEEIERRARIIGDCALRYFILRYEPKTGFVYNPEESVAFEGDTGPYLLYAIARINSLFREQTPPKQADLSLVTSQEALQLARLMRQTMQVVEEAATQYKPHLVARHAMHLGQAFTAFYHANSVLKADAPVRDARLFFLSHVKKHLVYTLGLLGIETLEEM